MDAKKILITLLLVMGAGALYVKLNKKPLTIEPTENQTFVPIENPPPVEPPIENKPEILENFTNYKEALEASKKYNRPIFLYFGADWCGYCKKMKAETFSDIEIKNKLSKEYITYFVNTDKDRITARKYKVSGIPAYMVVDSSETIIIRDSGFKNKEDMMDWLQPKNVSIIDEKY